MSEKKSGNLAMLVIVLGAISLITSALLGIVNMVTVDAIAANNQARIDTAMKTVLPADSYDAIAFETDDTTVEAVYQAGDQGYVVQVSPGASFSGTLTVMVGVNSDGTVSGVSIVKSSETSGLGANASKPAFRDQFVGVTSAAVTKDGGNIQALTGATITSRAVCAGVTSALNVAASLG